MVDPFKREGKLYNVTVEGGEMRSHGPCKISFSARYSKDNPHRASRVNGEIISWFPSRDMYEEVLDHLMIERLRVKGKLKDVQFGDVSVAMTLVPDSLTLMIPWPVYEVRVSGKVSLYGGKESHSLMRFSMYFDLMDFSVGVDESDMISEASRKVLKVLERGGLEMPPESKWSVVIFNKKTERIKAAVVSAHTEVEAMRKAMGKEDISNYLLLHPRSDGNFMTFDPDVKIVATKVD